MDIEVRHNTKARRYEIWRQGEKVGYVDYRERGEKTLFTHTEVDTKFRGEGLAEKLVTGALDDIRRRGRTVESRCPYVSKFLDEHPEYQDLKAA